MIDRKKFFDAVRRDPFRGLDQPQVDGLNFILDVWSKQYAERTPIPQFSVVLATSYHETAHTMQPIKEYGDRARFMRLYDVSGDNPTRAKKYGNVLVGDGAKYCGRGYVQLTWHVNYEKATKRLRELGIIGNDIDFVRSPDLVMKPEYAVHIMFIGMEEGWFTGRSLDQIVGPKVDGDEEKQFVASRVIINGRDRDQQIAGYAMAFMRALVASVDPEAKVAAPVVEKVQPVNVNPGATWWNRFWVTAAELFGDNRA